MSYGAGTMLLVMLLSLIICGAGIFFVLVPFNDRVRKKRDELECLIYHEKEELLKRDKSLVEYRIE